MSVRLADSAASPAAAEPGPVALAPAGRALAAALWAIPAAVPLVTLALALSAAIARATGAQPPSWPIVYGTLNAAYKALLLAGRDSWAPMLAALHHIAAAPGAALYSDVFFGQGIKFQYPATALLLVAWAPAPADAAIRALNLANAGFLAATVAGMALLARDLAVRAGIADPRTRALLVAVVLVGTATYYPLIFAAAVGQIQVVLDALLVFACLAWLRRRPAAAGVLIGLSTLVKPQMGLFVFWALLGRDWRFLAGWLLPAAAGLAASLVLYGTGWPRDYLILLEYIARHGESYFANQSLNGLAHRVLGNGSSLVWHAESFAPHHPVVRAATLAGGLGFVALGLAARLSCRDSTRAMAIAAIAFTMASPVAWEHHYGALLPGFAIALASLVASQAVPRWRALAVVYFAAASPLTVTNWLAGTPFGLLQSYVFFAGLGLLALLLRPTPAPA